MQQYWSDGSDATFEDWPGLELETFGGSLLWEHFWQEEVWPTEPFAEIRNQSEIKVQCRKLREWVLPGFFSLREVLPVFFSLSQNFFARVLSFKNVLPGFLFKRVIPLTSHMLEENMCPWQLCFKLKWIYGNNVFVSFNSLNQLLITEMYLWVDSQWFYFSSKRLEVVRLCSIFSWQ